MQEMDRDPIGEVRSVPPPSNGLALLVLGLLLVVLAGSLAVAAWSSGLLGQKKVRMAEPAPQLVVVTNVITVAAPSQPLFEAPPVDVPEPPATAAALADAVASYRDALAKGALDQASNGLAVVLAPAAAGSRSASSALGEVGTLRLYRLCGSCTGVTACAACAGSGACAACRSGRVCAACGGRPKGPPRTCVACQGMRCPGCGGQKLCAACQGYGTVRCERCRGIGNTRVDSPAACGSCGGKGEKPGLKRADGTSLPLPCSLCGGSGRVTKTELRDCLACDKKGRIACSACRGARRCAACGGAGKRKEACGACGGAGIIQDLCQACRGAGVCGRCEGAGRCDGCGGRGEQPCRACASKGVLDAGRFPVAVSWLAVTNGYWFASGEGLRRVEPERGAVTLSDRRIAWREAPGPDEVVVFLPTSQPRCAPLFKPR